MTTARTERVLELEGPLTVIESTGTWGVYSGERILMDSGRSFGDDLGIKLRKAFEPGARDALARGESPSESFAIPRVRVRIEILEEEPG